MPYYDVVLEEEIIGSVNVTKEGLYTRFYCRCTLPDTGICRLVVCCNGKYTDLGICVPQENSFILDKRIPSKRIGDGALQFYIASESKTVGEHFVPIEPDKPFAYITELHDARFGEQNGSCGIFIPRPSIQSCQLSR